ncbi:MAG: hypothetical protein RIT27_1750 [Pseudomonadota bacterium]|jgi:hypothetical protein
MSDNNKLNLHYFSASSMHKLYEVMNSWQEEHRKRLLSLNIQKEGELFSCIALTNPTEVVICDHNGYAVQVEDRCLYVRTVPFR